MIAKRVFGKESLPRAGIESWRERNNKILVCLHDASNRVVGYFDLLPLSESFASRFIAGTVRERGIRGIDLLAVEDARRAAALYLVGFAVCGSDICASGYHRRVVTLTVAAFDYLLECYPVPPERTVYALAATEKGRRMLERFGFSIVQRASERKDRTDLYALYATTRSIQEVCKKLNPLRSRYSITWRNGVPRRVGTGQQPGESTSHARLRRRKR